MLNRDRAERKNIEDNEKVSDSLNRKEDLFCEEEVVTVLTGLKNNEAPGADAVVNALLNCGGFDV